MSTITSESSGWQASPGKRLLGLRVTDVHGGRCGPGRIALRFVAGIPSWFVLHLGHALAAWTPGKRALHDYLAGTRVELAPGAPEAMPRGGRSWLLLQAALFFGAVGKVEDLSEHLPARTQVVVLNPAPSVLDDKAHALLRGTAASLLPQLLGC